MDFVGRRKIWYAISLVIIIPGLIALMLHGLNLGIDFTGGTIINLKFNQPVTTTEVSEVLKSFDLGENVPIQVANDNTVLIRTKALEQEQTDQIVRAFQAKYGQVTVLRVEKVGPVVGKELTMKAIYSVLVASVLMLIYITFRFEFKFGVAAVIALLHDVLVVLGVFALLRIEVDSSFIAALLTILGYSINDTIVIFDRIRENRKIMPKASVEDLVNRSITQTLTRSINTVLTVVFTLVALLLFGGETTKIFVLAMLIGVISGCYSSICNASPLWVDFNLLSKRKKRMVATATR
ncbi:MAG: protein translocase subunit SecF [Firmicutes bacterium]|nr:protein translocase subunit SecF [Bacillota bacterium]